MLNANTICSVDLADEDKQINVELALVNNMVKDVNTTVSEVEGMVAELEGRIDSMEGAGNTFPTCSYELQIHDDNIPVLV